MQAPPGARTEKAIHFQATLLLWLLLFLYYACQIGTVLSTAYQQLNRSHHLGTPADKHRSVITSM